MMQSNKQIVRNNKSVNMESPLATGHSSNQKSKHASSDLQEGFDDLNTITFTFITFKKPALFLYNVCFWPADQYCPWSTTLPYLGLRLCIDHKPRRHWTSPKIQF